VVTDNTTNVTLLKWQEVVISEINGYDDFIGAEALQALGDYEQNCNSMIQVSLRKGAGHTFLTGHIAKKYPSCVIYCNLEHYHDIELLAGIHEGDEWHEDTKFLSVYELRHDLLLSSKAEWIGGRLEELKQKIIDKKVIVIDKATFVKERCREVVDYICQVSQNAAIVLLG